MTVSDLKWKESGMIRISLVIVCAALVLFATVPSSYAYVVTHGSVEKIQRGGACIQGACPPYVGGPPAGYMPAAAMPIPGAMPMPGAVPMPPGRGGKPITKCKPAMPCPPPMCAPPPCFPPMCAPRCKRPVMWY